MSGGKSPRVHTSPPRGEQCWALTGETVEQENRQLRREVATLQQKQAFGKSSGVFRERVALQCAVIACHRGKFPVRLMRDSNPGKLRSTNALLPTRGALLSVIDSPAVRPVMAGTRLGKQRRQSTRVDRLHHVVIEPGFP